MELGHMGEQVVGMLEAARSSFQQRDRAGLQAAAAMDADVDELHRAVLRYIRDLGRGELTRSQTTRSGQLVSIANYLESIGDLVAKNLVVQAEHLVDLEPKNEERLVSGTLENVAGCLEDAVRALASEDRVLARRVATRKPEIKAMAKDELNGLSQSLRTGEIELEVFRIAADVVGQADRLFHDIRKMSEILAVGGIGPKL
jgi:phosphate:Na+ symporter